MNDKRGRGLSGATLLVCVALLFAALWFTNQIDQRDKQITYQDFESLVENEQVSDVTIIQNRDVPTGRLEITVVGAQEGDEAKQVYVSDVNEVQDYLDEYDVTYSLRDVPQENWFMTNIFPTLLILAAFFLFFYMMNRQNGGAGAKAMSFGKSRARMSTEQDKKITFAQVAGLQEEKEELEEIVDFLKAPKKYIQVGARIPKGVLLVGPPGTGKTLLAKAVAGEAGVPFFSISGSDFVEMFVGVGASRVRDLFEDAKKNAPCIIFIDEIDAVARRRGTGMGGGHDEREQTLNQLLVEMDGFGVNEGIIVMAATNRVDILDPAILRPGRFDRKVVVGRPDVQGREEILKVHAKGKPLGDDVDLKQIAQTTAGFTGADLENLLNEAAILAAKDGRVYLHINANGDYEPCAFIHYSDANVRTHTFLEAQQAPLFTACRRGQPWNENHLRPCPLLGSPDALVEAVNLEYSDAMLLLGRVYLNMGDSASARSMYQNYLDEGEYPGRGYNGLALCDIYEGSYDSALQNIQSGLEAGEDEEARKSLLYNEIVVYEYQKDFATAKSKMAEYLAAYPDDQDAVRENQFLSTR